MKTFSCILILSLLVNFVKPQYYDSEFWEGLDAEEEPYEHPWLDIPDVVNTTSIEWYFNMTHHFLTGI